MARDRFSDDHTFQVVGDTNTIEIKDNLDVENDATIGNDATVMGQLKVNEIAPESGTTTTFTQNVEIDDDLDVHSNLHVDVDATITGDTTVNGSIRTETGYEGPRSVIGAVNVFHTVGVLSPTGAGSLDTIALGAFGFTSDDVIYSMELLLRDSDSTTATYFSSTYFVTAVSDRRFGIKYAPTLQTVTVSFIGADWITGTIGFSLTIWYEET